MNPRSAKAVDVLAEVSGNSLAETYRVWAPRADSVALEVNGEPCHMHRDDRAWWAADRRMRPGDLYGFVLDGRGPFPDPRSRRQPSGVHGPSEVVDDARYQWTESDEYGLAFYLLIHLLRYSKLLKSIPAEFKTRRNWRSAVGCSRRTR